MGVPDLERQVHLDSLLQPTVERGSTPVNADIDHQGESPGPQVTGYPRGSTCQMINTKNRQGHQSQPATTESLRQQLHIYREEIACMRAENRALTDQLARHLGTQRNDNITRR